MARSADTSNIRERRIKLKICYDHETNCLKKVILDFPISLDFDDTNAKKLIYETWSKESNVPDLYPELKEQINKLKSIESYPLPMGISIKNNNEGNFISLCQAFTIFKVDIIKNAILKIFPDVQLIEKNRQH